MPAMQDPFAAMTVAAAVAAAAGAPQAQPGSKGKSGAVGGGASAAASQASASQQLQLAAALAAAGYSHLGTGRVTLPGPVGRCWLARASHLGTACCQMRSTSSCSSPTQQSLHSAGRRASSDHQHTLPTARCQCSNLPSSRRQAHRLPPPATAAVRAEARCQWRQRSRSRSRQRRARLLPSSPFSWHQQPPHASPATASSAAPAVAAYRPGSLWS
jgi:hypothetical protein